MDTMVQTSVLPSAPDRARALQPLLDAQGPEMDRRREVTPAVVEALVENDMLRLLLPRSLGGQDIHLLDFCKTTRQGFHALVVRLIDSLTHHLADKFTQCNLIHRHQLGVCLELCPHQT